MKNSITKRGLLAAILAASMLLTACGGSAETTETKAPEKTETKAAEPTQKPSEDAKPSEEASEEASEKPSEEAKAAERTGKIHVTDVTGRDVELDANIERMAFTESRLIYATSLLNKENPIEGVVTWGTDLQANAPDIYDKLLTVAPAAKDLPIMGSVYKGDLDIEKLVSLKPQVMFMSLDQQKAGESNGTLEKLTAANIPYLITDFRQDPVKNTEVTMEMLGKVMNKEAEAKKYLDFYKSVVDPISAKAPELTAKAPVSFIWRAPGLLPCCGTFSKSNFAQILVASGGNNLADTVVPGEDGSLTTEAVIKAQPAQIIATGGDWGAKKLNPEAKVGFLPMGYTIDKETAKKGLQELMKQPGFSELQAVKDNHVHGVYHQLYDSPWNFAAFQQFAKWSNPDAFADVDVDKTWAEFHKEFLGWEPSGTMFVSLDE